MESNSFLSISVITWNTYLINQYLSDTSVGNVNERAKKIAELATKKDVDFIGFQEVWGYEIQTETCTKRPYRG